MIPYRHRVNYYETDKMGVTHHANYIHWMEEARIAFLDQLGWPYDKLEELGEIFQPMSAEEQGKDSPVPAPRATVVCTPPGP